MKWMKDFRAFAVRGNVMDLAIGVVIGAAFSKITNSLVAEIFMPLLAWLTGNVKVSELAWTLSLPQYQNESGELIAAEVVLRYGLVIQSMIDFLLIALVLFFVLRFLNHLREIAEDPENDALPTPKNLQILADIRTLLTRQQEGAPKSSPKS